MGINDRDYMRRPVSAPSYSPAYKRNPVLKPSRIRRFQTIARRTAIQLSVAVVAIGIAALSCGIEYLVMEYSELAFVPKSVLTLIIASCGILACVGFLREYDSFAATPVDVLGGFLQAAVLTGLVVVGAMWLGVDFRVILDHEKTPGYGIPVFMGVVSQTPWWYLLICLAITGPLFAGSSDGEVLHWRIGTGFVFAVSAGYFGGKILLDTGLYFRLM